MLPYSGDTGEEYISWRNEGIAFDQLMIGKLASVTDIAYTYPSLASTGRIGTGRGSPGTARRTTAGSLLPEKPFRAAEERKIGSGDDSGSATFGAGTLFMGGVLFPRRQYSQAAWGTGHAARHGRGPPSLFG